MKKSLSSKREPAKLIPSWDLVAPSWRLLVEHFEPIIFLFVLPSLTLLLGSLLLGSNPELRHLNDLTTKQLVGIGIMGLSIIWSVINFAPSMYFRLQVAGGKVPSLRDSYSRGLRYFWRLVGLNLLLGVLVVIGLLLFIIPGIVLLIIFINRYFLANYYLIDGDLSIKQALLKSHHGTAPFTRSIWGTVGVQTSFGVVAAIISSANQIGSVPAIFIQLICLYLPALRYWEIKRGHHSAAR